jgi:hypothetical protein
MVVGTVVDDDSVASAEHAVTTRAAAIKRWIRRYIVRAYIDSGLTFVVAINELT